MRENSDRTAKSDSGGGSIWDRLADVADIAPVMGDPTVDPANEPWEVAMMAGWGEFDDGRGFDSMMGVDKLVIGEADAMEELHVGSATEGGPLMLAMSEDMDSRLNAQEELQCDDPENGDWTTHL